MERPPTMAGMIGKIKNRAAFAIKTLPIVTIDVIAMIDVIVHPDLLDLPDGQVAQDLLDARGAMDVPDP